MKHRKKNRQNQHVLFFSGVLFSSSETKIPYFFFFLHMDIRTCMSVNKQNLYYKQGLEPMVITKELLYLVLYNEKWICQLL